MHVLNYSQWVIKNILIGEINWCGSSRAWCKCGPVGVGICFMPVNIVGSYFTLSGLRCSFPRVVAWLSWILILNSRLCQTVKSCLTKICRGTLTCCSWYCAFAVRSRWTHCAIKNCFQTNVRQCAVTIVIKTTRTGFSLKRTSLAVTSYRTRTTYIWV